MTTAMAMVTALTIPQAAAPAEAAGPDRPPTATESRLVRHQETASPSSVSTQSTSRLVLVLLVFGVVGAGVAHAQSPCDPAKDRIYRITETEAQQVPDSLRVLLNLAAFVRACERERAPDGSLRLDLDLWLRNNEVLALVGLDLLDQAQVHVDRFFDAFFEEAPDRYRARFLLWRLHLHARAGRALAVITAYAEVQRYAHALDATSRASLYLDGAYAHVGVHDYETGLALVEKARALLSEPETYATRRATARALLLGAEAHLRRGDALQQAATQFSQAARRYAELGDASRVAIATTLRGMTYAAQGDTTRALAVIDSAAALAQQSGDVRSRTLTRYRQGQLLRQSREFVAAEPVLRQALDAADDGGEYVLGIAYELAMLYEQRRELHHAEHYYQTVVDAPRPASFAEALNAERKAHTAEIRLLLIRSERRHTRLVWALGAMGLLLSLVSVGCVLLWCRRTRPATSAPEPKHNGVYIPKHQPTGLSLEALTQRFQQAVEPELLGARLACLYAVLFDPDLVLHYIDDPYLKPQVETDSVENNTALFQCAAAVEEAVSGQPFSGRPENTLAAYLRTKFRQRDWPWPKNPLAWKRHFLDHHADVLL